MRPKTGFGARTFLSAFGMNDEAQVIMGRTRISGASRFKPWLKGLRWPLDFERRAAQKWARWPRYEANPFGAGSLSKAIGSRPARALLDMCCPQNGLGTAAPSSINLFPNRALRRVRLEVLSPDRSPVRRPSSGGT